MAQLPVPEGLSPCPPNRFLKHSLISTSAARHSHRFGKPFPRVGNKHACCVRIRDVFLMMMCFLRVHQVLGAFVNQTIDDQYGDLVTGSQVSIVIYNRRVELKQEKVKYSPDGFWNQGDTCNFCAFHPSNASAFNGVQLRVWLSRDVGSCYFSSEGTWHDGSRVPEHDIEPLEFAFTFTGTHQLHQQVFQTHL